MSTKPKAIGYIRNLTDDSMVHLVYPGPHLSIAFPVGHVYEMVADGEVPFKEFKEKDLEEMIPKETVKFSAGDLVKVVKQPPNQHVHLVGEVGFIDEIVEGDVPYAQIQTLHLDSFLGGCGAVPIDCLEPERGQCWIDAKRKHDEHIADVRAKGEAFSKHVNDGIAKIAEKYGLSVEMVEAISSEVRSLYP
ncbi:hypothetical protein M0R72_00585 [Candidatus Pacearchaeota archaeon]|nr:hypothetical protein [Candidatus Pacearchaeota archaeon]